MSEKAEKSDKDVIEVLKKYREAYMALHDGLSDMIEGGRLKEDDIPDDYRWLVETLADKCVLVDEQAEEVLAGVVSPQPEQDELIEQLKALKEQGLDFSNCINVFGVERDENPFAKVAFEEYHKDGSVEVDSPTVLSESDEGAYVLAWTWVTNKMAGMILLKAPTDKWAVLQETLEMDAQARNFDPELRVSIGEALGRVKDAVATDVEVGEGEVLKCIFEDDWDLLRETLDLDAESKMFDSTLRKSIREALESVEEVEQD